MQCDLCGKDSDVLLLTTVESSQLSLCKPCSAHGRVIKVLHQPRPSEQKGRLVKKDIEPQVTEVIVEDFAQRIKQAREKLGLKQEELAKKINEKESIIHGLETGHHHPNMELAKKLAHALSIQLIEQVQEEALTPAKGGANAFTLGDFIKVRKKGKEEQ